MSKELEAVETGREAASSLIPEIKAAMEAAGGIDEKVLWWTGFISAIHCSAAVIIGQETANGINKMSERLTAKALKSPAH